MEEDEEELDFTEEEIESIKELMNEEKTPKEISETLDIDLELIEKYI